MARQAGRGTARALRLLARKGAYEVLLHIRDSGGVHYNGALNYAMERRLIGSRSSITTILNGLTDCGLVDRRVIRERPARVKYSVNEDGLRVIRCLEHLDGIAGKRRPAGAAPPDEN